MMQNNIWKIEEAGLYLFGHINRYYLHVEISRKSAHWAFSMPVERMQEFLDILDIDYEDGVYVHEVLKGKFITVIGEEGMDFGVPVSVVGDPYGEQLMTLER